MEPGSKPQLEKRKICFSSSLLPLQSYLQLVPIGSGWDASLRHEMPHLWRYSKRGQTFTQMGQPVKVISVFTYTWRYMFIFIHILSCLSCLLFHQISIYSPWVCALLFFFFFFHNNWMPYSIILAPALLQLRSLRLWKALKNKSELSSYKTDIFLLHVFCPEQGSHCSDLYWTGFSEDSSTTTPMPYLKDVFFLFRSGSMGFWYTWNFMISHRLRRTVIHVDGKSLL